jgi:hypothetical protein
MQAKNDILGFWHVAYYDAGALLVINEVINY